MINLERSRTVGDFMTEVLLMPCCSDEADLLERALPSSLSRDSG